MIKYLVKGAVYDTASESTRKQNLLLFLAHFIPIEITSTFPES